MSEAASEKPIDAIENDRPKPADLVNANGAAANRRTPSHWGRGLGTGDERSPDACGWCVSLHRCEGYARLGEYER